MPHEIRTVVDAHLVELRRRNLRPSTIYQRERSLMRLQRQFPDRDLLTLNGEEIAQALDERGNQPGTRATEISHLSKFYEWAEYAHGTENPMAHVTRPRVPSRLPRPMPDDDLEFALRLAEGRVLRAMMLAAYAGFRAIEIGQSRYDHAVLRGRQPVIIIPVSKGGSPSTVPLHRELVDMLEAGPPSGWIFPHYEDRPGPSEGWVVSHYVNDFLHSIGIDHTLHSLRHWYGTKLYEASGNDLRTTQEGMRHASIASTVLYTWIAPGRVADAVSGIPVATRRLRSVN